MSHIDCFHPPPFHSEGIFKRWRMTSFCPTTVASSLSRHSKVLCFCGNSSLLKIKVSSNQHILSKLKHKFWGRLHHKLISSPPSFPNAPRVHQVLLSSCGGTWSGSYRRTERGRSGKARPVLSLLHLAGFLGPGDPHRRQTSASFLAGQWEEGRVKFKMVKAKSWLNLCLILSNKQIWDNLIATY